MSTNEHADILIIGSGIAGLSLSLKLAQVADVILVTKKNSAESATNWAQGGIAAVTAGDDDANLHVEDTLRAGAGLCDREVVELVVRTAPERIRELMDLGVRFTRDEEGNLALGREGGHSKARILHHEDRTGMEIESVLLRRARETGRLRVLEHHLMVDLLLDPRPKRSAEQQRSPRCFGAYVLDSRRHLVRAMTAKAVVLATGGSGMLYQHTTNPDIATGDGVIAAWRAGAMVGNLEFFQFHPTTFYEPDGGGTSRDLITEALRGHGGILRNLAGDRFMYRYDQRGELAPRDIVARAIDAEMKKSADPCVHLDCTHLPATELRAAFPHIDSICRKHGIDFTRVPIPVVPAAHYQCGGVLTDLEARTTIPGLFAVGEVALTGLHGANRLASNSLLEAIVFAHQAARSCAEWIQEAPAPPEVEGWSEKGTVNQEEWVLIQHDRDELRKLMWDYVGIVRSTLRLERASRRLGLLVGEVRDFYRRTRISGPLVELRNLALLADLTVQSALSRKESRGLHFMSDFPLPNDSEPVRETIRSLYSFPQPASAPSDP